MNEHTAGRHAHRGLNRRGFLVTAGATAVGAALATTLPERAGAAAGAFRVPVEDVRHTRTWMAWPDSTAIWGGRLNGVQADIALIARTIAGYEPVVMCANSGSAAKARQMCGSTVTVISSIPVDDCWMRDTGPVFRTDAYARDARRQYGTLTASTTATGRAMDVMRLQGPEYGKIRSTDRDFLASYAHLYLCNDAVVSARFGDRRADEAARAPLRRLYPDRYVEQLDIDRLGTGGGGIHCVTQQQPAA
ncbi:agmatine deiminase family protein [Streptomyces sp. NPDC004266]|uniref:agmatine deiminase family protein n=1 Tax=Streptomyces sp. NPDC004266 TaxID=3364693 RepID=UPI00367FCF07